nr:post-COAP-1 domain-containing protein [Rhabdothermincola salaria]
MLVDEGEASATITGGLLSPGVHNLGVRVVDAAGNWSDTVTISLVVYDPTGDFVTGGGWIVPGGDFSDSGDDLPGLDGSSKANFGFVVKYRNGASTTPDGNLQFVYRAGDFRLHSESLEWLVTNPTMAQFQGTATIDGLPGSYRFSVQAIDGGRNGADRFRLRVFGLADDPLADSATYQASGDVSGGNIIIHRR